MKDSQGNSAAVVVQGTNVLPNISAVTSDITRTFDAVEVVVAIWQIWTIMPTPAVIAADIPEIIVREFRLFIFGTESYCPLALIISLVK
jgi:hypothetical protein